MNDQNQLQMNKQYENEELVKKTTRGRVKRKKRTTEPEKI